MSGPTRKDRAQHKARSLGVPIGDKTAVQLEAECEAAVKEFEERLAKKHYINVEVHITRFDVPDELKTHAEVMAWLEKQYKKPGSGVTGIVCSTSLAGRWHEGM